jgi:hypothetical protein
MAHEWTEEEENRLLELRTDGLSFPEIARQMNKEMNLDIDAGGDRVRAKYNAMIRKGHTTRISKPVTEKLLPESLTKQGDNYVSEKYIDGDLKDDTEILEAHGFDPSVFKLLKYRMGAWNNGAEESDGTLRKLRSSRIEVAPIKIDDYNQVDIVAALLKDVTVVEYPKVEEGKDIHVTINMADCHFGIMTLEDYLPSISQIENNLIGLSVTNSIASISILNIGDLFHSSQILKSVTMNGTQLDEVDMMQALEDCKSYFQLLMDVISRFSSSLHLRTCYGNHSGNLEVVFNEYLDAKYPQLQVHNHGWISDAFLLGENAIMITHGDYAQKRLTDMFMGDYEDVWGVGRNRSIITGHYHNEKTTQLTGATHYQLATLKKNDPYESINSYHSPKNMTMFVYDTEHLRSIQYIY